MKDMPLELKFELLKELHPTLLESPFFATKDQSFVVRIVNLLKPVKIAKNEFLWKKDEKSNYIIFITRGDMFMMVDNIYYDKLDENERHRKILAFENSNELNIIKLIKNSKYIMQGQQESKDILKNAETKKIKLKKDSVNNI